MPTFSRFGTLLRLRRLTEPSSRPPGRPSPGGVEAGGHGSGRSKRKCEPRVDQEPQSAESAPISTPSITCIRVCYIYIDRTSTESLGFCSKLGMKQQQQARAMQSIARERVYGVSYSSVSRATIVAPVRTKIRIGDDSPSSAALKIQLGKNQLIILRVLPRIECGIITPRARAMQSTESNSVHGVGWIGVAVDYRCH